MSGSGFAFGMLILKGVLFRSPNILVESFIVTYPGMNKLSWRPGLYAHCLPPYSLTILGLYY